MTPQSHLDPPRSAEWLIALFANPEEAHVIHGDLAEEFSSLASQSGRAFARRWYWRQTLKSLPHLVLSAFRTSPWSTTVAIVAGFLLRRLIARLPELATFALIERFDFFDHHFTLYKFLASTALDLEHVFTFLLVGCVVGLIARRHEMAPAIALAMIYGCMSVIASMTYTIRVGDYTPLIRMSWNFTDAFAIVLGGILVRTLRSQEPRPSLDH